MRFSIKGHPNVLSTHKTTLEFTKEDYLTKRGDCILGVEATFDFEQAKEVAKKNKKVKIIIEIGDQKEEIVAVPNKNFNDKHEMVIRTSDFISKRTFAIKADKASLDLDRTLVEQLKDPNKTARVEIRGI